MGIIIQTILLFCWSVIAIGMGLNSVETKHAYLSGFFFSTATISILIVTYNIIMILSTK